MGQVFLKFGAFLNHDANNLKIQKYLKLISSFCILFKYGAYFYQKKYINIDFCIFGALKLSKYAPYLKRMQKEDINLR